MVKHAGTIRAIRFSVYLLLALLPLALTTVTANATEAKTTLFSLAVVFISALLAGRLQAERSLGLRHLPLHLPVVAYLGWTVLDAVIFHYRYATLPQALRVFGYVGVYFVVIHYFPTRKDLDRLLHLLVLSSIVPCIYGVFQHFRIDPIAWIPSSHERILATFGNPTYFGAYLALTIPIIFSVYLAERRSALRSGWLLLLGLQLACMLWTYSRGPWIGMVLALMIGVGVPAVFWGRELLRQHWKGLAGALSVLLLVTIALSVRGGIVERAASSADIKDKSNEQRVLQWRAGYRVFCDHPIAGVGPGALKVHIPEKLTPAFFKTGIETVSEHAHNEFIEVAADTGIIGLLLFLWVITQASVMAVKAVKHADRQDWWLKLHASALLGGVAGLLVCNLVGVTMRYSCGAVYFWVYLGLLSSTCKAGSGAADQEEDYEHVALPIPQVSRAKFIRFAVLGAAVAAWFAFRPFVAAMEEKNAHTYLSEGRIVDAQKAISRCLELSPHNTSILYSLASLQAATGDYNQALKTYTRIQKLCPNYGRIHYNIGVICAETGRLPGAVKHLERAAALDGLPETWKRLSEVYAATGDSKKAACALAKSLESESFQTWKQKVELAEQYAKGKRLAEAERLLRDVLESRPDLVKAHLDLASVYEKSGTLERAAQEYRRVLEQEPSNLRARTNLGCIYYEQGDVIRARNEFGLAAKKGGGPDLNANLALVYWRMGDRKRALEQCELVLGGNPDSPAADQARAIIYRITGKKRL